MDDLRTRPRRESVGRSLGLLALLLLGTADAALARIDVSTTATRNGTVIQGTITLSNASSTAAGITSLRNTLEVSFDGGYVPPGLPVGSRSDYYVVATAFPTTPASVAGHGSVVIPFSIDVCDDGVASYPGSRAHDVRTVAVLTSPAGNDDAHSDAVSPPPNQSMCPVCGNGVREGDEQCDGGGCCTAACTFAVDGASCSDGNACTQTDQCQSGSCVGGSPVTCAASDQCHAAGTCSPSTGACSNPARPNGTACNDGNACSTGDVCSGGVCGGQAMNCDDGNVCTTDSCSVGTCAHANNTAACDDGNACTTGDTCAAGACTSGGPRDCDDHRACTTDTCVAATGCAHAPTDVCDTCHAGDCTDCRGQCAAAESACSAGCWSGFLQCLAGCGNQTYCAPFCQVDFGQCANACPSAGAACDAACDTGNGCATECAPASADNDGDGVANGADNCPVTANPDQADRDGDGIGDACDPQTCGNGAREGTEACDGGSCCTAQCTTAPNGTTCDDGNACTRTDACQAGACAGSNPVVCAPSDQCHAAGACNPSTGTCSDPARPNGSACNDADVCTSGEVCGSGQCGGGAAVTCDDHEPCTTDACAAPGGCTHTPIAGCTCQAGACNACRAQCGTTGTCSSDCWSTFLGCLDGCTLTYCAAFCQADLGQCLGTCPPDDACLSDCDATNGCGSACTVSAPSTDRDGDAVADAADDCADMWNPGQADIDGDGTGDACDDSDATLATAQAVVRAGAGGLPKGRVTLKGTFGTTAAGDVFDASSAIAVTVTPGTGPTMEVAWPPEQCRARSATKITCAAPDRSASATFQAGKTGIWKFKVTMTGLVVASPTSPLVVDVRHGLGPIDRVGHLTVCTAPTSTMKCAMP